MANFFNSYFYGKSRKKDFTEADLPANRLQLFRDTLMVRKGSMVGLNLLYLLIWIPAVLWTFINLVQLYLAPYEDPAALGAFFHQVAASYLLVRRICTARLALVDHLLTGLVLLVLVVSRSGSAVVAGLAVLGVLLVPAARGLRRPAVLLAVAAGGAYARLYESQFAH